TRSSKRRGHSWTLRGANYGLHRRLLFLRCRLIAAAGSREGNYAQHADEQRKNYDNMSSGVLHRSADYQGLGCTNQAHGSSLQDLNNLSINGGVFAHLSEIFAV